MFEHEYGGDVLDFMKSKENCRKKVYGHLAGHPVHRGKIFFSVH
jgi:hypothetical protein